MLVLSRKAGERIHIGDDVFIEVRRVAGNRVTLAVNAPRTVRVLRGELLEAAKSFEETPCCETQCCESTASEKRVATQPETIIVTHEHFTPVDHFPVHHGL
jgi:carbon storage regulator CsrA